MFTLTGDRAGAASLGDGGGRGESPTGGGTATAEQFCYNLSDDLVGVSIRSRGHAKAVISETRALLEQHQPAAAARILRMYLQCHPETATESMP